MKRAFLALFLFCGGAAWAVVPAKHEIDRHQAEMLVMASLSPQQRRLPKLEAVRDDAPASSRFFLFTVTWEGVQNGSVIVGNYAVDPLTGDVFSSTRECYEEKNKKLGALQAKIRTSIHLSPLEYHRIKTKGPLCSE